MSAESTPSTPSTPASAATPRSGAAGPAGAAGSRAELEVLLKEYAAACAPASDTRARLDAWPEIRLQARQNWISLMESFRTGRDITEDALWKLLPYKQTPLARAHNAFLHITPAFREDPRTRLLSSGVCSDDDFVGLGRGLFEFVLRCDDYPADLWQACESFAAIRGGKAFTSGMLSPFLNALRPDDFVLINAEGRAVLNHFCRCGLTTALTDYSTANSAARELLRALGPLLRVEAFKGCRAEDVFEGFCNWLVNTRLYPMTEDRGADPYAPPAEVEVFPTSASQNLLPDTAPTAAMSNSLVSPPVPPDAASLQPPPAVRVVHRAPRPVREHVRDAEPAHEPAHAIEPEVAHEVAHESESEPQLIEIEPADPWLQSVTTVPEGAAQRDETLLGRCLEALERKGQIVLYGPPGSGKGRLARRIAAKLVEGGDGLRAHLAFHSGWTYSDFIQQQLPDGQRRLGRFTAFCRKAVERRGRSVLVIEDLQRAHVADVLGEALVLLEQRGSEITLAGGGSLAIPRQVRLIATIDSSHDMLSEAEPVLRQRFEFIALDRAD